MLNLIGILFKLLKHIKFSNLNDEILDIIDESDSETIEAEVESEDKYSDLVAQVRAIKNSRSSLWLKA